jgi:hypothetical protein
MVGPSRLYCATEGEAFKWICENVPLPQGDVLQLVPFSEEEFLQGLSSFSGRSGGRELDQPLFKEVTPKPPACRLEFELTYSVSDKEPASTSASASAPRPHTVHEDSSDDDDADQALSGMDAQFSKWASGRREGINAIPFAVVRAPEDAHATLIARDRSSWSSKPNSTSKAKDTNPSLLQRHPLVQNLGPDTTAELTSSQSTISANEQNRRYLNKMTYDDITSPQNESLTAENALNENDFPSKRAYLIAKAKLAKDKTTGSSSVLTSMSATQKRAAAAKNKNRKPIMETPELTAVETKPKQTMVCYENNPEGHRNALKLAIENKCIDPNNEEEVKNLMYQLEHTTNKMIRTNNTEMERQITPGGAVIGELKDEDTEMGGMAEQSETAMAQRLKAKAKKKGKKSGADK